jgi:hypothetical protein
MPLTLQPIAEAVAFHNAKTPVGSILRTSQWAQVPVALRTRAQFSAAVESARILQRVQDGVRDILSQARGDDGVVEDRARLRRDLMQLARDEGLTSAGADSGEITDIGSAARTDLIVRTQTSQAYGHAEWKTGQDEDALDAAPAQELYRLESRQKPRDWLRRWVAAGGQLFNGRMIAPKSSPIWTRISRFGTPWPPFDFNSGMWTEDVLRPEAESLGVIAPGEDIPSNERDFNEGMEAGIQGVGPELRQNLQNIFGPQIDIDGDRLKWKGDARDYEALSALGRTSSRTWFTRSEADAGGVRLGDMQTEAARVPLQETLTQARVEIGAVAAGRKPIYHEQFVDLAEGALNRLASAWQKLLPQGIRIRAEGEDLYAWNPGLLERLADPKRPLWPQVKANGNNGRWLGYGINQSEDGPKSIVHILDPEGRLMAGFLAPRGQDELYGVARARDWTDATGIKHTPRILRGRNL